MAAGTLPNVIERSTLGEVGESDTHVDADERQPDSCRCILAPSPQVVPS